MSVYYKIRGEQRAFPPGFYLVSRPKLLGLIKHYGVLATGISPDGADVVYQLAPGGFSAVPYEEYAAGKPVAFHEGRAPHHAEGIGARLRAISGRRPRYNALRNNCEHAARWVLEGKLLSTQLQGAIGRGLEFVGVLPATY